MKPAAPWQPGLNVAGRYRLHVRLGGGASAEVWRAIDAQLEAPVAIKLLDPQYAGSPVAKRFLREARATAKLRSLHVVQILDHGLYDSTPYITMELLEGETLARRLDRVTRLDAVTTVATFEQISKAATKAHAAGIVHRDLKPENVFLVRDADEEIVKVFDFGIAKVVAPPKLDTATTSAGTLLGTPHYMSPRAGHRLHGRLAHRRLRDGHHGVRVHHRPPAVPHRRRRRDAHARREGPAPQAVASGRRAARLRRLVRQGDGLQASRPLRLREDLAAALRACLLG